MSISYFLIISVGFRLFRSSSGYGSCDCALSRLSTFPRSRSNSRHLPRSASVLLLLQHRTLDPTSLISLSTITSSGCGTGFSPVIPVRARSAMTCYRLSYPSRAIHGLFPVIAGGIVWAPDTLLPNILEGLPVFCKQGSISGRCLVPPKYDIAIGGVIFDETGSASGLLCSDQCRAGATKWIEHDIAPTAAVLDRIGNKSDRLDGWVQSQFLRSPRSETVHPGVVPDVRPIAASLAKAKSVQVGSRSDLENKDEFMLRTIECSHAAIGLVPHTKVLKLRKNLFARGEEFGHMTPVHADEGDGPVLAASHRGS